MQYILRNNQNKVYFTLEYDAQNNWIYANWIGYASTENIKKGAAAFLELIKSQPCAYFLNNNQELVGAWDQANDWLEAIWVPQARDLGLRYMAHILSPTIAAALSGQDLHRRVDGNFEMRIFGNMEKAKTWLHETQAFETA